MNAHNSLNAERQAIRAIEQFLDPLPNLQIDHIEHEGRSLRDAGIDFVISARNGETPVIIVVEFKNRGQPSIVRDAAQQLRRYLRTGHASAIPIVMAPYLSPQARDAAREEEVGYLDFLGNGLIAFDTVYIEKEVAERPETVRRELRSLYKPKAARILRALLAEPGRQWRTAELAHDAGVSAGMVSTVGAKLREYGWAEQTDHGLALTEPDELLDAWRENYEPPRGEEHRYYTAFHGEKLTDRLRALQLEEGRVALASYSAAQWLSPFTRHPNSYFYADVKGLEALKRVLDLSEAPKGGNVVVVIPEDDGVLADAQPVGDGLVATSPVQTYLDLAHAGDRGEEGANHLRHHLLNWRD